MWSSSKQFVTTNDGIRLAYEKFGNSGPVVVLIHGWGGSRNYFDRNARALGKKCQVYAYDLRFHGESDQPKWGYHVARLAADLRDFLEKLDLKDVVLVGASLGAAVIWSYIELFGENRVSKAAFVDQAPLQFYTDDWKLGSKGCYDTASLTRLQCSLKYSFRSVAEGNCTTCMSAPVNQAVAVLMEETLRADPNALASIMADHAQLDWRPILSRITLPCLNIIGGQSAVFPVEGVQQVTTLIKNCHEVMFEKGNHWMYIEEPEKFNNLIADFSLSGIPGVKQLSVI